MNNNRINIKRILLAALAIVITITIGISIAKAEAVPARPSLEERSDLGLHLARRALDLRADLGARLTRAELTDVAALNRVELKGENPDALDNLGLANLGAHDTLDGLDLRLLG